MHFYGTLDLLLKYTPPPSEHFSVQQSEEKKDNDLSLEGLLGAKVQCLSDILADIQHGIQGRKDLFENVIYRIYQHYCYLKGKLFEMYQWPINHSRAIETRRSGVEKQLDTLKQEKRKEQVQCWQDIAGLKKEFRVWLKQYSDLAQRVRLITGKPTSALKKLFLHPPVL